MAPPFTADEVICCSAVEENQTSAVTAVIAAVALGAFLWWRRPDSSNGDLGAKPRAKVS